MKQQQLPVWRATVRSGPFGRVTVAAYVNGLRACTWDLGRRRQAIPRLLRAIVAGVACVWAGTEYQPTVSVENIETDLTQLGF
jgi:hypothetical protein